MLGKILGRGLAMVMMIPLVIATVGGLILSQYGHEMVNSVESGGTTEPGLATEIVGKVVAFTADRKASNVRSALFSKDALSANRTVELRGTVLAQDLLGTDELPPPHLIELYAEARLIAYARAECARINAVLAVNCMLAQNEISSDFSKPRRGAKEGDPVRVSYSATYGYAPAYELGDVSDIDRRKVDTVRVELGDKAGVTVPAEGAQAARADIYAEAIGLCASVKAAHGNCVVKQVMVIESGARKGEVTLKGHAVLAWLAKPAAGS